MARQATAQINLTARDTATVTINRLKASLVGLGGVANRVMGGLTGFGSVAGVAGLTMMANRAIQLGSRLDDVSKKLGIGTDFLQEFGFAAREVGVRTESAEMALQRFSRRLGEAQKGTGELLPTLKEYNIALKNSDGTARSAEQVLRDYADAIRSARDPQEQLRMAFKAFDSEGAALVTVLRGGASGLDEFARKARELNQVMSSETVQSLAAAENSIERFGQSVTIMIGDSISYWRKFIEEINDSDFNVPGLESMLGATPVSQFQSRIRGLTSEQERIDLIGELIDRYSDLQDLIELNEASGGGLITAEQVNQTKALMITYQRLVKDAENAQRTPLINQSVLATINDANDAINVLGAGFDQLFESVRGFNQIADDAFVGTRETAMTFADELRNWVAPGFENVKTVVTETAEETVNNFDLMGNASRAFATGLEDGLANAAANGKAAFGDMAQFVLAEIQRILIRMLLFRTFMGLGFTGFAQNFAPPPIPAGGARSAGGPVQAGRRYMVGERGPEMITMGANGYVTPNNQLGGPTFNIDMRGASLEAVQRLEQIVAAMNGSIEQRSVRAVQDAFSRQPSYMRR